MFQIVLRLLHKDETTKDFILLFIYSLLKKDFFQIKAHQQPFIQASSGNLFQNFPHKAFHREASKAKGTSAHDEQKLGEARFEPRGLKKCMCNVASQRSALCCAWKR